MASSCSHARFQPAILRFASLAQDRGERGLRLSRTTTLNAGLTLALALWGGALVSADSAERPAPNPEAGNAAYLHSCARCHGVTGQGDGVDAKRFYPRPRNLTLGVYKFRSTASGTPPTDADLFQTITRGLPGSNMPDWQHLDEKTRWQLVDYLKSLSTFFDEVKPEPVKTVPDPGPARADRQKGQQLYEQLGCVRCHGANGRANGPSAPTLVDDWGMPIRPANLTQGWAFRGGSDERSVMMRVLTGIDGTGMPSHADVVSPEDAWHLAYYVTSLQETPRWNMIAHASYVRGALPTALDDSRWNAAERSDVRVRHVVTPDGVWASPPTVKAVSFQVLFNAEAVAFRFSWDDPSNDTQPPDRLALVLKPEGAQGDVVTLQAWPYAGAPRLDFCVWSSETNQASETLAEEFDSVIAPKAPQGTLTSVSGYEDGRWRLMVVRPLAQATPPSAARIVPEEFTSVAFVVWDGANPNARAVSPWMDVVLRKHTQ